MTLDQMIETLGTMHKQIEQTVHEYNETQSQNPDSPYRIEPETVRDIQDRIEQLMVILESPVSW